MWGSIYDSIASLRQRRNSIDSSRSCLDLSDDDICSNASAERGLECPICWESFNIVENVPYVLWCGHTLCKNCILSIKWTSLKFSNQQIQIPFFVSCPWCHMLTLRLVYRDNLKFPRKNFFLLWMVESLNGERLKSPSSVCRDHQPMWSPRAYGSQHINTSLRRALHTRRLGPVGSNSNNNSRVNTSLDVERPHFSLHKSLDYFIHFTAKFPLVIVLLLIVIFVIPASAAIFALYLLITFLFALPSFLVLYFAYPGLNWLVKEITS